MDEENFMKDDCQPPLIGVVTTVTTPQGHLALCAFPWGSESLSLGERKRRTVRVCKPG